MALETKMLIMRWTCLSMAVSSFALGAWMMIEPNHFWGLVGVPLLDDGGMSVGPRVIYGGAILGEGVALALIFAWPVRYLGFLHYMMAYKLFSCVALAFYLTAADPVPVGGWLVFSGWAIAGLIAAAIYPWGHWQDIVRDHLDARAADI